MVVVQLQYEGELKTRAGNRETGKRGTKLQERKKNSGPDKAIGCGLVMDPKVDQAQTADTLKFRTLLEDCAESG